SLIVDCFFSQAEDGIRDFHVTGVQTCALPIYYRRECRSLWQMRTRPPRVSLSDPIGSCRVAVLAFLAFSPHVFLFWVCSHERKTPPEGCGDNHVDRSSSIFWKAGETPSLGPYPRELSPSLGSASFSAPSLHPVARQYASAPEGDGNCKGHE